MQNIYTALIIALMGVISPTYQATYHESESGLSLHIAIEEQVPSDVLAIYVLMGTNPDGAELGVIKFDLSKGSYSSNGLSMFLHDNSTQLKIDRVSADAFITVRYKTHSNTFIQLESH